MAGKIMYEVSDAPGEYIYWCKGCGCCHYIVTRQRPNQVHAIWQFNGDVYNPTVSPSVLVRGMGICHHFIKDGMIQYLSDCQHSLANQILPMWDIDGNAPFRKWAKLFGAKVDKKELSEKQKQILYGKSSSGN